MAGPPSFPPFRRRPGPLIRHLRCPPLRRPVRDPPPSHHTLIFESECHLPDPFPHRPTPPIPSPLSALVVPPWIPLSRADAARADAVLLAALARERDCPDGSVAPPGGFLDGNAADGHAGLPRASETVRVAVADLNFALAQVFCGAARESGSLPAGIFPVPGSLGPQTEPPCVDRPWEAPLRLRVEVFGSHAQGSADKSSDIDVGVRGYVWIGDPQDAIDRFGDPWTAPGDAAHGVLAAAADPARRGQLRAIHQLSKQQRIDLLRAVKRVLSGRQSRFKVKLALLREASDAGSGRCNCRDGLSTDRRGVGGVGVGGGGGRPGVGGGD